MKLKCLVLLLLNQMNYLSGDLLAFDRNSTIISDEASFESVTSFTDSSTDQLDRPDQEIAPKCFRFKLDRDIQEYYSRSDILPRLKDIRKKYPGESFTDHEVTPCTNEVPDEVCELFASKGACLGQFMELEEQNYVPEPIDETWKRRTVRMGEANYHLLFMMEMCRETCKTMYGNTSIESLPKAVQIMGGFEDVILDNFKLPIHICDLSKGFTLAARKRILELMVNINLQTKVVPKLHPVGFEKVKIPRSMYAKILTARKRGLRESKYMIESCDNGMQNCGRVVVSNISQECHYVSNENYWFLSMEPNTKQRIFEELKPLAEKWIKNRIELVGTAIYGIRKYTRGAYLASHVDHLKTHVVSAILNIEQNVDEDWPLQIVDHEGIIHEVILSPGEMVWYESAKLLHARAKPLKGKSFENLFVHYMPRSLNWYTDDFNMLYEPTEIITLDVLDQSEAEYKERRRKVKEERKKKESEMKDAYNQMNTEERLKQLARQIEIISKG